MHINLLPRKLVIGMLLRRRLRQWAVAWAMVLTIGLLVLASHYRSIRRSQKELDTLAKRVNPLEQLQMQTVGFDSQQAVLQREIGVLESICVPDRSLVLLTILGRAAKWPDRRIQIEKLSLVSTENEQSIEKKFEATSLKRISNVSLQGIADGDVGLASYVERLRDSNVFSQVELKSSLQYRADDSLGRQFQIECKFLE